MIADIKEIKDRVSIVDVLEMYGQHPAKGRTQYRCFAHNDTHPSAGITKDGKYFYCFACGFCGDIFSIVQHFEQCNFVTAIKILDEKFNLGLNRMLTCEEHLKRVEQEKERKRMQEERAKWRYFENRTINKLAKEIRIWEYIRVETREEQQLWDIYVFAQERLEWLHWLYDTICQFDRKDCRYDYLYPADKMEMLQKIKKGEIII